MDRRKVVSHLSIDSLMGLKEMPITTDILGSYTGVPEGPYEQPVQDADDL